jgi:hypothetical protein
MERSVNTANFLRLVLVAGLLGAGGPALADSDQEAYDKTISDASAAVDTWGREMFDALTQKTQFHNEVLGKLNDASANLAAHLRYMWCRGDQQASDIDAFIHLKLMTLSTVASGIKSDVSVTCNDHNLIADVSVTDFKSTNALNAQTDEFAAQVRRSAVNELAENWSGWVADNLAWWTAHPGERDSKSAENMNELRQATQAAAKHLAEIACDGDAALPDYAEQTFADKAHISADTIRSSIFEVRCNSGKLAMNIKVPSR